MWNKETYERRNIFLVLSYWWPTDPKKEKERADKSQQAQGRTAQDSCTPEAYLESCQTSKAERFAKIVEGFWSRF